WELSAAAVSALVVEQRQSGAVRVCKSQAASAGRTLRIGGGAAGFSFATHSRLPDSLHSATRVLWAQPAGDGATEAWPACPYGRCGFHFRSIEHGCRSRLREFRYRT